MKHPELILALWILMLKWTGIVGLLVGIGVGYFTQYWIACVILGLTVAAFFLNLAAPKMQTALTGDRYAFWISMLALPVLVATIGGYFAGRQMRRARIRRAGA